MRRKIKSSIFIDNKPRNPSQLLLPFVKSTNEVFMSKILKFKVCQIGNDVMILFYKLIHCHGIAFYQLSVLLLNRFSHISFLYVIILAQMFSSPYKYIITLCNLRSNYTQRRKKVIVFFHHGLTIVCYLLIYVINYKMIRHIQKVELANNKYLAYTCILLFR